MSRLVLIPAVYLFLLNDKNQILLIKRKNTGYEDGKFSVPAGHLKEDESLEGAIIREAEEEIGIDINNNVEFIKMLHRIPEKRLDFFYKTKRWKGKLYNKEPNKCEFVKWFDLYDLPNNIIDYVKEIILENRKELITNGVWRH